MTELTVAALIIAATVGITASGEDKPVAVDSGSDLLWKKVESRIDEIAMRFDGVMGVAIVDLTDGQRTLLRNADHVFPAASSIKLAILLELYHAGKASVKDFAATEPPIALTVTDSMKENDDVRLF